MRWNLGMAALAASWGFIAVLVSAVEVGAAPLAFARLALAAATLLVVALLAGRAAELRPQGRLGALALLGVVQGAHWLLFFAAVKHGSVALAVVTFYTAPILIALAAPVVLDEPLSRVTLVALVPGCVGVVLVASAGEGDGFDWLAVTAGLGSAASYAVLVLLGKRLLSDRLAPVTVAFWDCFVGAAFVAPFLALGARVVPSGSEWGAVLLLGVVFTGLSTLAYAALLRHVTAQAAGVLTFLEPVSAILLAAALLDDRLGWPVLLGGGLVVAAGTAVVLLEPTTARTADVPPAVGSGSS